jgi:S-DNA-T family DNA segregation ATPase FtsK/SpoIIIE
MLEKKNRPFVLYFTECRKTSFTSYLNSIPQIRTISNVIYEISGKNMPLKTPSSPPKSSGKPSGKTVSASPSGRGKSKLAPPKKKSTAHPPPAVPSVSWWDALTDERKLDVVGLVMVLVGLATALILFSAQKSDFTGSVFLFLRQAIGWGVYLLPFGMIIMGFWLIFRRIEKLPRLSLVRALGFILLFLWLPTVMHSIIPADMRDQAALDGIGGGYVGNFFAEFLFNGFGPWGVFVILLAWLLLTITMILDITVRDLFRWVTPLSVGIRGWMTRRRNARAAARAVDPVGTEV